MDKKRAISCLGFSCFDCIHGVELNKNDNKILCQIHGIKHIFDDCYDFSPDGNATTQMTEMLRSIKRLKE